MGKGPITNEQKHYQLKVREMRRANDKESDSNNSSSSTHEEKEREPKLNGVRSDFDFRLFQEAQAASSEKLVRILRFKSIPNYSYWYLQSIEEHIYLT